MKVFIVYAHPEPLSFNAAMKELAVTTLKASGNEVIVSDLCAMKFKAAADGDDFTRRADPEFLKYAAEQKNACADGSFAADIKAEQEKLLWADFVIFQFPLWWYSVPAILKGWFDRVFAAGFVYGPNIGRYDTGGLRGRRAMLSLTTGSPKEAYGPFGMDGDMNDMILYHINHGTLYFSGLQPTEPYIAWTPSHDAEERVRYLEEYRRILEHLDERPNIVYHPGTHYGSDHRLLPQYRCSRPED